MQRSHNNRKTTELQEDVGTAYCLQRSVNRCKTESNLIHTWSDDASVASQCLYFSSSCQKVEEVSNSKLL